MIHYEKLLEVAPNWLRLPEEELRRDQDKIFSPDDFFGWAEDRKLHVRTPSAIKPQDFEEMRWNVFVLSRYIAAGQRVFRVEPGLARLLLDTDLPKLTGEMLGLPFPAVYLEFPSQFFICPKIDQALIGCYLTDLRPEHSIILADLVIEPPNKNIPGISEFVIHINIQAEPGKPVEWGNLAEQFSRSFGSPIPGWGVREIAAFVEEVTCFVANSVLYATSASPEITEVVSVWRELEGKLKKGGLKEKVRDELKKRLHNLARTQKYKLGKSIPVIYGAPRAADFSPEARQARKILKRFQVRGHWRWQAYGVGRKLRKHIFIQPFWKGPADLAELLKRKYEIK